MDDPSVASVDAEGKVTGLSAGAATLTATMLPSGRSVSVPLKITGGELFRFDDVRQESAYYFDAVYWAYEKTPQITTGTSEKRFSPDLGCTRAQAVTFLHRYEHTPKPGGAANPFADVKPDAYYYDAVLWAVENKITNGTSATAFSPDKTCTRAQIVTFLYRDLNK